MTSLEQLSAIVRERGPLRSCRVSSAQARGKAKQYSYWGAVRYRIRFSADGRLVNTALERATSDRRSQRLAHNDLLELADAENRVICGKIGALGEADAEFVLQQLGKT